MSDNSYINRITIQASRVFVGNGQLALRGMASRPQQRRLLEIAVARPRTPVGGPTRIACTPTGVTDGGEPGSALVISMSSGPIGNAPSIGAGVASVGGGPNVLKVQDLHLDRKYRLEQSQQPERRLRLGPPIPRRDEALAELFR